MLKANVMLIIDSHEDIAYNAIAVGRDVTLPVEEIRRQDGEAIVASEGMATASLPALRVADIRVVFATLFAQPHHPDNPQPAGYATPEQAQAQAMQQLTYYETLHTRSEATLLRTREQLDAVLCARNPLPGLLPLMEGADQLLTSRHLPQFVARGVRMVGLAWHATRYAGGTGAPGPLTDAGVELLREMDQLGVALDASHLAEEAFWQATHCFHGRIIASHANCRALVPGDRQLTDDMLRAIADRDGVIGLVFYNRFIRAGWVKADGKAAVSLDHLRQHADHLAQVVGTRHIGIGTDLDGCIGYDEIPAEIHTIADLPKFANTLTNAGYTATEVAGIMGNNWLRVLRAILDS